MMALIVAQIAGNGWAVQLDVPNVAGQPKRQIDVLIVAKSCMAQAVARNVAGQNQKITLIKHLLG